ncbi:hypothetical protein NAEGRDRAFT_46623 [Naegleria gruberi]|uniref:F-box domain-containing protein n=1 Tax=Naegleria gruberi TaxID=5762 RepID=D2V4G5_NAEGR|nr:uncharacterized protein NAEGRDRAFT_46623 [Naegleria gruberi]EFC48511.1 hypothetical protein NAEGRDRAFT_46623 [Naegleria gruberi]|eukprot:XP_002681255.1 hypothetical protein NAEGRDRAFT_46623 [Naegleria gruberi strain NEG-M]
MMINTIIDDERSMTSSPSILSKSCSSENFLHNHNSVSTINNNRNIEQQSVRNPSNSTWSFSNFLTQFNMTNASGQSKQQAHSTVQFVQRPTTSVTTLEDVVLVDFNHLPEEILQHILYYFTREELLLCTCRINSTFYRLSTNRELWWHHTFVNNPNYIHKSKSDSDFCSQYVEPSSTVMYSSSYMKRIQHIFKVSTGCQQSPKQVYKLMSINPHCEKDSMMIDEFSGVKKILSPELQLNLHSSTPKITTIDCINYFLEEKLTTQKPRVSKSSKNSNSNQIVSEDASLTNSLNGIITGDTQSDIAASITDYFFGSLGGEWAPVPPHKIFPRYRHTMTVIPSNSATPNVMIIGGILNPRQMHADSPEKQGIYTMNAMFVPGKWNFEVPKNHEVGCQRISAEELVAKEEIPVSNCNLPQMFGKHSAVYAPSIRSVVVFGGAYEDSNVSNDLYVVKLTDEYFNSRFCSSHSSFKQRPTTSTTTTSNSSTRYHNQRRMSTSRSVPSQLNELQQVEPPSNNKVLFDWKKIVCPNTKSTKIEWPAPRTNHCSVMINDRTMIVIGGGIGPNMIPTNEVWCLDVVTMKWTNLTSILEKNKESDTFTPRLGFAATLVNQHSIVCYGGGYWVQNNANDKYWRESYNDVFVLDLQLMKWTKMQTSGDGPTAGTFPSFSPSLIGTHWYIIGGGMLWDVSSSIYQLNTVNWTWSKVGESFGADSSCLVNLTMYQGKNKAQTKLIHCGGYRYEPLLDAKVFSVNWKDEMDKLRMDSIKIEHNPTRNRRNSTLFLK